MALGTALAALQTVLADGSWRPGCAVIAYEKVDKKDLSGLKSVFQFMDQF